LQLALRASFKCIMSSFMRLTIPFASKTGFLIALAGCTKSGKTEELQSIASVCNALKISFQVFAWPRQAATKKRVVTELISASGQQTGKTEFVHSAAELDSAIRY